MTREPKAGQTTPAVPNPDHDRHAAGIYQCIALRFYVRYADARRSAEFRGNDIEGAEPLITELEAGNRYEDAVAEWVLGETSETADAVLALTEFVGVVAADKLVGEALRESGPVSDEKDTLHQVLAIGAIGEWLSESAQREWLDRRIAAYGPSGMAKAPEPEGDDAIIAALREYEQLQPKFHDGLGDAEADALAEVENNLQRRIDTTPPTTMAGALAKLRHLVETPFGKGQSIRESNLVNLQQLLAFLEREAGA